jgi:hypothetical protein
MVAASPDQVNSVLKGIRTANLRPRQYRDKLRNLATEKAQTVLGEIHWHAYHLKKTVGGLM